MDLSLLHDERGLFSLLELTSPQDLATALGLEAGIATNDVVMAEVLTALMIAGGQQASGLVLESEWGLPAYQDWVEKSNLGRPLGLGLKLDSKPEGETPAGQVPFISPNWGVENIANNYALAFLELQYHPSAPEALAKKQLLADLFDFCEKQKTQLLLKLVITEASDSTATSETQLIAVQELRSSAHALALEVPGDPLAAATLTAELDIPWIATPGPSQTFPQFSTSVAQALENGAQGYLIGQTAWGDISQIKRVDQAADINQVKTFVNTTFRDRLSSLNQMVAETVKM